MISAIRCTGVIQQATIVLDAPMDRDYFLGYIQQCLVPALRRGDIVVMDNLAAHKRPEIKETIESAGYDLWYLPAYSPDLNPIEKLWSKVKTYLRSVATSTIPSLIDAIAKALRSVHRDECWHYCQSCGYGR